MKNNTQDIASELKTLGVSLPASLNNHNPFAIPEAYFENFAGNMLLKLGIKANNEAKEELMALSPFLASLKKDTAFTAPADYFETLSSDSQLFRQTKVEAVEPKVIGMNTSRNKNVFRYAVAAAIVGVLGISMFFLWNNDKKGAAVNGSYATGLPEVPDDVLKGFLSNTPDIHPSEFVDSSDTAFFDQALLKIGDENEIASMLKSVPDNDLSDYDNDLL